LSHRHASGLESSRRSPAGHGLRAVSAPRPNPRQAGSRRTPRLGRSRDNGSGGKPRMRPRSPLDHRIMVLDGAEGSGAADRVRGGEERRAE
jgi:hypothetical protein